MRIVVLVFLLALLVCFYSGARPKPKIVIAARSVVPGEEGKETPKVDFSTEIKPIFVRRCQPCHFNGGVMYERLPFDRPETIKTLGTKLFSRIRNETEQDLIRKFLSQ
jgi:hypothetical protein